ncbi:MAG: helicase HerA-like domain-containing protein [Hyphomicrobiaceae bacterium]
MLEEDKIYVGKSDKPEYLTLRLANRHGLVTGATGTGKTVTMQVLAEGFSDAGVPVFAADIKGDLSGIAKSGTAKDFILKRNMTIGFDQWQARGYPTVFWDVFGEHGHPVRATIADMGSLLLARLMDLNEVQEGVLAICFRVAEDENAALLDLKDLRAMLSEIAERRDELGSRYGNIAQASIGAIQRRLLVLEDQGADRFFGEPALDLNDFMRTTYDGRGFINVLVADKLFQNPKLYATFLLWMLTTLWSRLPEVGDPEKPKLVFFFDEAHLLFDSAPKALLERVEQVARLIRSKGVGVYFVTQNPLDVPDTVSSQLGNRIQHALRAFTPREQRAVRAAATTFRQNPNLNTEKAILELGVGEALVSFLENRGEPSVVERTLIRPPSGHIGPLTDTERADVMGRSPVAGKYDQTIDRDSAHEIVARRRAEREAAQRKLEEDKAKSDSSWTNVVFGRGPRGGMSMGEQVARSMGRSMLQRMLRSSLNAVLKTIGLGGRR